jgi:hypothetical protein
LDADTSVAGIKRRAAEVVATYPKSRKNSKKRQRIANPQKDRAQNFPKFGDLIAFAGWEDDNSCQYFHIGEIVDGNLSGDEESESIQIHYYNCTKNQDLLTGTWTKRWNTTTARRKGSKVVKEVQSKVGSRKAPERNAIPMTDNVAFGDFFCTVTLSRLRKIAAESQNEISDHLKKYDLNENSNDDNDDTEDTSDSQ